MASTAPPPSPPPSLAASPLDDLEPDAWTAVRCAARAARGYGISSRAFLASVVAVSRHSEMYSRVGHHLERRRIIRHIQPAHGPAGRAVQALPNPRQFAAWSVDPATFPAATRRVAPCPNCVICSEDTPDATCPTCTGSGLVLAWLEVQISRYSEVYVHPQYLAERLHPHVDELTDFDRSTDAFPANLDTDTGWQSTTSGVRDSFLPPMNPKTDRLVHTRVQHFSAPVYSITYRTPQGRATVDVAGRHPRVLPLSNWRPLQLRRRILLAGVVGYLVLAGAVPGWLVAQLWSSADPALALVLAWFLWACGLGVAAISLFLTERFWTLLRVKPRRRPRRRRSNVPRAAGSAMTPVTSTLSSV